MAKSVTATAPQGVSPQRGPVSPRSPVATFNGMVEAMSPVAGATIEDANTASVDQEGQSRFRGRYTPTYQDHRDVPRPGTGVIDTPTQSFVSMLEFRDTFDASKVVGDQAVKKFVGRLVGKAVAIYEANIQAAANDQPHRGDTVSLTL
ncbi:MAG: hypothetical protein RIC16_02495 [Rhodospirillales bacterium]